MVSTSLRPTLPQQASSNTVDLNMNGNMKEQLEEVSQDNYTSSSDPEIVSISSSSDTESELEDILIEENAEEKLEDNMFEPLHEGANISISGAYCAIMEFK